MTRRVIVDLANYQANIDLVALKRANPEVAGAILKATEGSWSNTNPYYDGQYASAEAAGLAVGHYTFEHPSIAGTSDAQTFLNRIAGKKHELGVWIDAEISDGVAPSAMLGRLLEDANYIAKTYPMKTGFYTADWWWGPNTVGSVQAHMENWPLWVAGYQAALPKLPAPWTAAIMWQFTDKYAGLNLDASVFLGTDAQWNWLLTGSNVGPAPAPATSWINKIKGVQSAVHVTPDGVYGPGTDAATEIVRAFRVGPAAVTNVALVKSFQAQQHIGVDGKWGPITQNAWINTVKAMQRAMGCPATGAWDAATEYSYISLNPLR